MQSRTASPRSTSPYQKEFFNTDYRGAYLGRSVVAYASEIGNLFYESGSPDAEPDLYPESLTEEIERQRNMEKEHALLVALRDGHLEPPGGVIRFRGEVIRRSDLGEAIETVQEDLAHCRGTLEAHDRKCRSYHRHLARNFGNGWLEYHESLLRALPLRRAQRAKSR